MVTSTSEDRPAPTVPDSTTRGTSRRVRVNALAIPVHDCADLLQTALPRRADAADGHVQLAGDGRVVVALVEEEEDEQFPLTLGQLGQGPVQLLARHARQRDLLRVFASARPRVPVADRVGA